MVPAGEKDGLIIDHVIPRGYQVPLDSPNPMASVVVPARDVISVIEVAESRFLGSRFLGFLRTLMSAEQTQDGNLEIETHKKHR